MSFVAIRQAPAPKRSRLNRQPRGCILFPCGPSCPEPSREAIMADGKSSFVYVTYIRTTPEELWAALTTTEFMRKYWFGMSFESDWKAGSAWQLIFPDGRIADTGDIVELD